jgi:pyrroline-5-carboxylate reductase
MRIGLIGAGKMASALARGLGEPLLVADAMPEKAVELAAELGGEAPGSNRAVAEAADVVVLCHKPAQLAEVADEIADATEAVVSILGGTRLEEVEAAYPDVPAYRFIPNIPAEVRRGVFCYSPGTRAKDGPEDEVLELFGRAGVVIAVDEPVIDAATALMSCGPAFLALTVEALVDAGTAHGLDHGQAARMVNETLAGTAAYLDSTDLDYVALRERVATPGGLTARGLDALEQHGLRDSYRAAVDVVVEATAR